MKAFFSGLLAAKTVFGTVQSIASQVIATVKVAKGTEVASRAAVVKILAPTRAEAGNVSCAFTQSVQDPTEFSKVEVWLSQTAIDLYMKTAVMRTFFQTVGSMFTPGYPVVKTYQSFEE